MNKITQEYPFWLPRKKWLWEVDQYKINRKGFDLNIILTYSDHDPSYKDIFFYPMCSRHANKTVALNPLPHEQTMGFVKSISESAKAFLISSAVFTVSSSALYIFLKQKLLELGIWFFK